MLRFQAYCHKNGSPCIAAAVDEAPAESRRCVRNGTAPNPLQTDTPGGHTKKERPHARQSAILVETSYFKFSRASDSHSIGNRIISTAYGRLQDVVDIKLGKILFAKRLQQICKRPSV